MVLGEEKSFLIQGDLDANPFFSVFGWRVSDGIVKITAKMKYILKSAIGGDCGDAVARTDQTLFCQFYSRGKDISLEIGRAHV